MEARLATGVDLVAQTAPAMPAAKVDAHLARLAHRNAATLLTVAQDALAALGAGAAGGQRLGPASQREWRKTFFP
jgi:hypothetical protein